MTNFAAKIAGVATLALAALPVVALTTAAHAAPTPMTVKVADLNLGSSEGMRAFERRVHRIGARMCGDTQALSAREPSLSRALLRRAPTATPSA